MNIENRVYEIQKTTAWMNQQTIQKKENDRQKLKIQTQHLFHEISLIRYFSYNTDSESFGPPDISYEKIMTEFIQHEPLRLHSKLSPNISQFITQWVFDFTKKPKMFAEAVIKTLPHFPEHSGIFIYVTFPSMFNHFQTDEYLSLAVEFLEEIIQNAPSNMSISFVSAFLLSSTKFVHSLWKIFDELVDKRSPLHTYTDYFILFIEALKNSSISLTKQHVHIIKYFKKFNLQNFSICLISNFLNVTYDEAHHSKIHDDSRQLIHFLKYAEKNPTSPHFTKIFNALVPRNGTLWVPFHSDLIESKIPLVMNCHEFFLIQEIAKENPELSNLKYIHYLSIPETVYSDFYPVYFDVVFPLPQEQPSLKDQLSSLIFNEKFYEEKIDNFIVKPPNPIENEIDSHVLSRRWRQVGAYARSKNIHPLSLFSSKIAKIDPALSTFNFSENSPLFQYGVKEIYSEALKIQNQFEIFINKLLLSDFLEDLHSLLMAMLKDVLMRFTLRLIRTDRIYDSFYLNEFFYSCDRRRRQQKNFAVMRYSGHFVDTSEASSSLRGTFFPMKMKSKQFKKLEENKNLYEIFFVQLNKDKKIKKSQILTANKGTNDNNGDLNLKLTSNSTSFQPVKTVTNSGHLKNNQVSNSALTTPSKTVSSLTSNMPVKVPQNAIQNSSLRTTSNPATRTKSHPSQAQSNASPTRTTSYTSLSSQAMIQTTEDNKEENNKDKYKSIDYNKKRRHSLHSMQFVHTNSQFYSGINRILKSRGRAKSPLQICMISKIIDEWKIFYFEYNDDHHEDSSNNINRQMYGNGEVCEFVISSLQKSFISHLEMFKTKMRMKGKNDEYNELKSVFKYIQAVAKEINEINKMKKGSAIFQMVKIGRLIGQISERVFIEKSVDLNRIHYKVFELALLMAKSDGFFETFLLYEKLSADIIGFNTSIPLAVMKSVVIIVNCFWTILKKFDDELYLSCIHFVEHMQYSFSI